VVGRPGELTAMDGQKGLAFQVGDRVRILHSTLTGKVVELRGPLSPKGVQVYRVRYRGKPKPAYIEVREDQLEIMPAANGMP
jgi:hypothetical protein